MTSLPWRVTRSDWKQFKRYDDYYAVSEHVLRLTSTGQAPWVVVEGKDARYRELTVGRALLEAMPVKVILNDKTALLGAARRAALGA